jgi:hypothetical protein
VTTTAVPHVIDYLVAAATASTALGAATVDPVTVYDGPVVLDQWPPLCLWIGVPVEWVLQMTVDNPIAATSTQDWVGPGNRLRDEDLSINCVAEAWYGGTDIAIARNSCASIMAAVEDMTRINANASGTVLFTKPGVTGATWHQQNTTKGARVLISFAFTCFARIGS